MKSTLPILTLLIAASAHNVVAGGHAGKNHIKQDKKKKKRMERNKHRQGKHAGDGGKHGGHPSGKAEKHHSNSSKAGKTHSSKSEKHKSIDHGDNSISMSMEHSGKAGKIHSSKAGKTHSSKSEKHTSIDHGGDSMDHGDNSMSMSMEHSGKAGKRHSNKAGKTHSSKSEKHHSGKAEKHPEPEPPMELNQCVFANPALEHAKYLKNATGHEDHDLLIAHAITVNDMFYDCVSKWTKEEIHSQAVFDKGEGAASLHLTLVFILSGVSEEEKLSVICGMANTLVTQMQDTCSYNEWMHAYESVSAILMDGFAYGMGYDDGCNAL